MSRWALNYKIYKCVTSFIKLPRFNKLIFKIDPPTQLFYCFIEIDFNNWLSISIYTGFDHTRVDRLQISKIQRASCVSVCLSVHGVQNECMATALECQLRLHGSYKS